MNFRPGDRVTLIRGAWAAPHGRGGSPVGPVFGYLNPATVRAPSARESADMKLGVYGIEPMVPVTFDDVQPHLDTWSVPMLDWLVPARELGRA